MLISVKLLTKYVIRFMHQVRYMKSWASESKAFQSPSKDEIPGRARRKELTAEPFQIETGVPN